ncbi:MAG TPA: nuclear transport factor 2 family protein [Draconibacterium sp.]|nr:nuclear transport factor 2 family protein [Draconibacterium sp.]
MRILFTVIILACISLNVLAESPIKEKEVKKVNDLLDKQVNAWNKGNIGKFMDTYWKSDDLVFVGSKGVTYGWQPTLENYKRSYPNKKAMGNLRFDILDIRKIDKKTIFVVGRFFLTRNAGNVDGHFTLVVQKKAGKWVIVSDHSSADD